MMNSRFVCRLIAALCFALAGSLTTSAAEPRLNPLTEEVVAALQLDRPELAGIKNAKSPLERQEALYRYFMNRQKPVKFPRQDGGRVRMTPQEQEWADAALQHRFIGQPKYPLQSRGKDEIDWESNPFPDPEWLVQFHRLNWWPALAKAFTQKNDEKYAKEFVFELDSYRKYMYRKDQYDRHPGWRGLEICSRIKSGVGLHELFRGSREFSSYDLVSLLWLLDSHQELLFRKMKRATDAELGNHEMHIWSALLEYYAYFPEFRTHAERARHVLDNVIKAQDILVFDDGVINECVTSYHTAYPEQFLDIMKRVEPSDPSLKFPPRYREKIEKGITAVMLWSHPDGTKPQFGDSWTGGPNGGQQYVGRYLNEFKRPDWEYFVTDGKKGKCPDKLVHTLGKSGYYTMRSKWGRDALFLVMKNSDTDYLYHNHMDNLSFELFAFGKLLMADSGCYCYNGSAGWRGWFRQASVHPLVTLDNRQIAARGQLLWSSEGPGLNAVCGRNQAYPELAHTRTVFMVDGKYIVIFDRLDGEATGTLRQHFQFMPGPAALDASTLSAVTQNTQGPNLFLRTVPVGKPLTMTGETGWISQIYMKKEPRPAFAFVQAKEDAAPRFYLTLLAPTDENSYIYQSSLAFAENGVPTDRPTGEIRLSINNFEHYTIRFDEASGKASLEKKLHAAPRIPEHDAYMILERRKAK